MTTFIRKKYWHEYFFVSFFYKQHRRYHAGNNELYLLEEPTCDVILDVPYSVFIPDLKNNCVHINIYDRLNLCLVQWSL